MEGAILSCSVAEPCHFDAAPDPAPDLAQAPGSQNYLAPTLFSWRIWCKFEKCIHFDAALAPSRYMMRLLTASAKDLTSAPEHCS
jgi:hypothetical protein